MEKSLTLQEFRGAGWPATRQVGAMRLARLRALFDRYDVDKSGTLGANALEHMLTELGGRDDASAGGGLLVAEFGDADGTDGRALSFDAFVRLVTKLESEAAEPRDDETRDDKPHNNETRDDETRHEAAASTRNYQKQVKSLERGKRNEQKLNENYMKTKAGSPVA